ncbi:hypothetical protein KW429_11785 [Vibrio fluvialis]|nr:hypothetical protein [Vibrio fluvialis]
MSNPLVRALTPEEVARFESAEQNEHKEDIKLAEKVVRELRLKSFDIEDELIARAATGG